jgi:cytochrome P450
VETLLLTLGQYRKLAKWQKEMSKISPGPKYWTLLGNAPLMVACGGFTPKLFDTLHREHGDFVCFFIGPTMVNVTVNNPDICHEVYKLAKDRPVISELVVRFMSREALVMQRGGTAHTKELRTRHGHIVQQREQLERVHEVARDFMRNSLSNWTGSERKVDYYEELGEMIYNVMGEVVFDGPWLHTVKGQECYKIHRNLLNTVDKWLFWPFNPWFHPEFLHWKWMSRRWRVLLEDILQEKRVQYTANPTKYQNDKSALTLIVSQEPLYSEIRQLATLQGMLNAGFETTLATLYWITWFLAKYPEMQDKLLQEFKSKDASVDDLRECEYLHAFILEVLRMIPPIPVIARANLSEDITVGGFTIPKGTNINMPNCVMFKDERWVGPEPEKFRPERMLNSETTRRTVMTVFGEASRMCVGFTFAFVELKVQVHTILTAARIELADINDKGEISWISGVAQPKNPAKFIFRPRETIFDKVKSI